MLKKALQLAKRPEERKLVIAAWGTVGTPQALDTLVPLLAEKGIAVEAGLAVIAAVGIIGEKDKTASTDALQAVIEKSKNKTVRSRAQRALDALER